MTSWSNVQNGSGTGWGDIPKPVNTTSIATQIVSGGIPIGMLVAITNSSIIGYTITTLDSWTSVLGHSTSWNEVVGNMTVWGSISPNSTSWTNVPNAT